MQIDDNQRLKDRNLPGLIKKTMLGKPETTSQKVKTSFHPRSHASYLEINVFWFSSDGEMTTVDRVEKAKYRLCRLISWSTAVSKLKIYEHPGKDVQQKSFGDKGQVILASSTSSSDVLKHLHLHWTSILFAINTGPSLPNQDVDSKQFYLRLTDILAEINSVSYKTMCIMSSITASRHSSSSRNGHGPVGHGLIPKESFKKKEWNMPVSSIDKWSRLWIACRQRRMPSHWDLTEEWWGQNQRGRPDLPGNMSKFQVSIISHAR